MKTSTQRNNITKLVNAGIIEISLPKMGGIFSVNNIKFDTRSYYEGRGTKFNKNINHEFVEAKITQKELAKAMRHYKMSLKVRKWRKEALKKAGRDFPRGEHQYTFTNARKLYFPEIKEISRKKI